MATWGGRRGVGHAPRGACAHSRRHGLWVRTPQLLYQLGRNHQAITPVWVHREPRNVTAAVLSGDAAARTSPNFY